MFKSYGVGQIEMTPTTSPAPALKILPTATHVSEEFFDSDTDFNFSNNLWLQLQHQTLVPQSYFNNKF